MVEALKRVLGEETGGQGESTTSNQGRGRGPANQGEAGRGQEGSGEKGPANQGGGGDKGLNRPRPKVHRMANGKSYISTCEQSDCIKPIPGVIVQVP